MFINSLFSPAFDSTLNDSIKLCLCILWAPGPLTNGDFELFYMGGRSARIKEQWRKLWKWLQ